MKRLTTDNPQGNFDRLMNFAFDKDHKAMLSYADGEENVELHSYISKLAKQKGIDLSPDEIMEDGLMDFADEDFAILYYCAVQAAELRARLKMYEDKLENGTLVDLPFKVGDKVYQISEGFIEPCTVETIYLADYKDKNGVKSYMAEIHYDREDCPYVSTEIYLTDIGKTVFLTKDQVEKALEDIKKNG